MEHEIEVTVRRYTEGLDSQGFPNQVEVYKTTRIVVDLDPNPFDVFDDIKLKGADAINEDVRINCQHEDMRNDDLEVCPVCGVSIEELRSEAAEDAVDEAAHDAYYEQKYGDKA